MGPLRCGKNIRVNLPIRSGSHSTIERSTAEVSRVDDGLAVACDWRPIPVAHYRGNSPHTPTPEVPRRTSLVRNLRRPWAPREHSPERTNKAKIKKSTQPPPCAVTLAKCRRLGARYPAQAGQAGAGGSPSGPILVWFCLGTRVLSPVSEGGKKVRISNFSRIAAEGVCR